MPDFANRLKSLRNNRGVTQTKLAEYLNVSQNAIYNWENGKREPSFSMLEKIAAFYDVSIDYLLGTEIKYEATSNYEDIRNDYIDTLAAHFDGEEFTDEELDEIMNFVEFVKNKRKK